MASINEETFRLKLDGLEVPIATSYIVQAGILNVPAGFSMTVGHGGLAADLLARYPEFTPFELYVGDVLVQRGETDASELVGASGTQITLRGRDLIKWLVDVKLENDRSFAEKTFLQLTEVALQEVGLGGLPIATDNTANRKAITGVQQVRELAPLPSEEQETEISTSGKTRTVHKTIKATLGSSWWDFLSEQYRRAGLFLWADVSTGGFVLSRPRGNQTPLYRIVRRKGSPASVGDVTIVGQPQFSRDATKRFTEIKVLGRAGGGKGGRGRISARVFDAEMIEVLNPNPADRADGGKRRKPEIIYDDKVKTTEQAQFLARRKLAESRRNGWSLTYTVAGHTAPALVGGGRAVWQPDTVVEVIDEHLGIEGLMWIESVEYSRTPYTTSKIHVMRIEDLLFAEEDFDSPPKLKKKGANAIRMGKTEKLIWKADPQMGGLPTAHIQSADGRIRGATGDDFVDGYFR